MLSLTTFKKNKCPAGYFLIPDKKRFSSHKRKLPRGDRKGCSYFITGKQEEADGLSTVKAERGLSGSECDRGKDGNKTSRYHWQITATSPFNRSDYKRGIPTPRKKKHHNLSKGRIKRNQIAGWCKKVEGAAKI